MTKPLSIAMGACPVVLFLTLFAFVKSKDGVFMATEETLKRTLDALDMGLDFIGTAYKEVNLDAAIGTRLVAGQLEVLLKRLKDPNDIHLSDDFVRRIRDIQQKAKQVSNMAEQFVKTGQPFYYQRIGTIIQDGFWTLSYPAQNVDPVRVDNNRADHEVMHESDSDDCLTEFFGTGVDTSQKCRLTRHCWKLMTAPGYSFYSLSHQTFYLQIGEQFGCFRKNFQPYLNYLNAGFCTNMLTESEDIANANFPEDMRDLFMEQAALCGPLGYKQFFRDEWLEKILSWQRTPRGCWGIPQPGDNAQGGSSRTKREEHLLKDGCQCHRTAVALGALSQYTRFITEFLQGLPH